MQNGVMCVASTGFFLIKQLSSNSANFVYQHMCGLILCSMCPNIEAGRGAMMTKCAKMRCKGPGPHHLGWGLAAAASALCGAPVGWRGP